MPAPTGTLPADFVRGLLRAESAAWPPEAQARFGRDLLSFIRQHSVEALAFWRLSQDPARDSWPAHVREDLAEGARSEAVLEAGRIGELRRLLAALAEEGVIALLVKGAALGYLHYPEPWLRPRNDNDLLVRRDDVARADRVLTALGYRETNALGGDLTSYQSQYVKTDDLGFTHAVDLHWKLSNRPRVSDVLPFDELARTSTAIPALGPAARTIDDVHALVLACVHTAAHHRNCHNLIWSYDVHLLASRLDEPGFARLAAFARSRGIAAICATGLHRAEIDYHTALPSGLMRRLEVQGEESAAYLGTGPWRGDVRLDDLRALPDWRARARLVRQVVLPPREYMLRRYDSHRLAFVPFFHVHRLVLGTWRLVRRLCL
ncbi:MAG: nucleotidyltransferase family protein [Vicinamibacterales bacterium]